MIASKRELLFSRAPQRFERLMDVYEQNYVRLQILIPRLAAIEGRAISCVPGGLDLHLHIVEKHKYTTLLRLSYCFPGETQSQVKWQPDLLIKIYHDAQVAEAQCDASLDAEAAFEGNDYSQMWQCWYWNRFLHKWLGYCIRQGHSLLPYAHYRRTTAVHFWVTGASAS